MPPSLLLRVLDDIYGRVERLGVSPVVAGGLAVSYWGHPRSTQDIDLAVIVSDELDFESGLRQASPRNGARGGGWIASPGSRPDLGCGWVVAACGLLSPQFGECVRVSL